MKFPILSFLFLSIGQVIATPSGLRATQEDVRPEIKESRELGCKNDYVCPQNSSKKPGRACYDNFDDCQCNYGYKKQGNKCVKDDCKNDYVCPANSSKKPGRDCYNNFDDCQCDYGYKKQFNKCVKDDCKNDYICPANSSKKPGRDCYNNFDDCQCDYGYVKWSNKCIKNYVCPQYSYPYTNNPTSFDDCKCIDGYKKWKQQCVKDYVCPSYSTPITSNPWSFDDCKCNYGYEKTSYGQCVWKYQCPEYSHPISSYPHSFDDCTCEAGYVKWDGECQFKKDRVYAAEITPIGHYGVYGVATVVVSSAWNGTMAYSGTASGLEGSLGPQQCTAGSNACGAYIHSGYSCSDEAGQGNRYFDYPVSQDPWNDAHHYTTNAKGYGTFSGEINLGSPYVNGRAFVVYDRFGKRVACGLLHEIHLHEHY